MNNSEKYCNLRISSKNLNFNTLDVMAYKELCLHWTVFFLVLYT